MDLEKRITQLEADMTTLRLDVGVVKADVASVKTDTAVIKSNYATKADLSELKASLIMWIVGGMFAANLLGAVLKKFGLI